MIPSQARPDAGRTRAIAPADPAIKAFVARLHFYIGLFVGPFVLVAAITGTLYVLTPQIEDAVYRHVLTASEGTPQPLAAQAAAGRAFIGEGPRLFAVRPAAQPGTTTRVMFTEPGLGSSESRAVFVDPVTLEIKGEHVVYGTSGILPLRTGIDYLHRSLMLGDVGRLYSELAASWLWIAVVSGVALWWWRPAIAIAGSSRARTTLRTRQLHSRIGVIAAIGLVFLSVTGLTWSQYAGGRIDEIRAALGWITPSVSLQLPGGGGSAPSGGDHGDHAGHGDPGVAPAPADHAARLDEVEAAARTAGIDTAMIEIRPPQTADQGWMIREYDRSWPTQVDTVVLDPRGLDVVSRADFATFPIIAKLIRWGIDLHMGILFGIASQMLMAALSLALILGIVLGYRMWWRRRPSPGAMPKTLVRSWLDLSATAKAGSLLVAALLAWLLPLQGISLLVFVAVDALRYRLSRRRVLAV